MWEARSRDGKERKNVIGKEKQRNTVEIIKKRETSSTI